MSLVNLQFCSRWSRNICVTAAHGSVLACDGRQDLLRINLRRSGTTHSRRLLPQSQTSAVRDVECYPDFSA
jgi:hypothetical protein